MRENTTIKNPGKILPKIVLRPFVGWQPYKVNNRHYVFDYPSISIFIPGFIAVIGIWGFIWLVAGTAAQNMKDILLGDLILLVGGGGCILTYRYKHHHFKVFDREKGVFRSIFKPKLFSKQSKSFEVPFEECEGSLHRLSDPRFASLMFEIQIRHPSFDFPVFADIFSEEDHALGFWSFLVQYMDKDAALPDIPPLSPYANRTKGVASTKDWKTPLFTPGHIDPLEVWQGRQQFNPPERAIELFEAFEPGQMPANVSAIKNGRVSGETIEPCGEVTALPKKVLRPFTQIDPARMDEDRFVYDRPMPDNRYYYFSGWVLLCAAIALFSVNTAAAVGMLAATTLYFAGFRWLRRSKGTILDRKNGVVIFHEGLRFTPTRLPFDECQGRLIKTEHAEGFDTYRLHLYHLDHGSFALDNDTFFALDYILGFWSFIVQFMDKTTPLPAVEATEKLDNTTKGMGPWEQWPHKASNPNYFDPFAQWLESVEQAPIKGRRQTQTVM